MMSVWKFAGNFGVAPNEWKCPGETLYYKDLNSCCEPHVCVTGSPCCTVEKKSYQRNNNFRKFFKIKKKRLEYLEGIILLSLNPTVTGVCNDGDLGKARHENFGAWRVFINRLRPTCCQEMAEGQEQPVLEVLKDGEGVHRREDARSLSLSHSVL